MIALKRHFHKFFFHIFPTAFPDRFVDPVISRVSLNGVDTLVVKTRGVRITISKDFVFARMLLSLF